MGTDSRPVLVYQIGALGDTLVSIPCYRALRRHFSGRRILLIEAQLEAGRVMPSDMLVKEKLIDGTAPYPHAAGIKSKLAVWRAVVRSKPFAVAYIGPAERPPNMVARDKSFFRLCKVKNLVGFHGIDYGQYAQRDEAGHLPKMPHQSVMRLDRLAQDGVATQESDLDVPLLHPSMEEKERVMDWLGAHRRYPDRKLVALGVKTAKPVTQWPMENFDALGRMLASDGRVELVVSGGPADRDLANSLTKSWGQGLVAAGDFGLHEMGALLAQCDLYVGLDTGTTHLAGAVGAPILLLASDHTQPGEWDPMGNTTTTLIHRVPCGGCRTMECHQPGHPCMTSITVPDVYETVLSKLELT